MRSGTSSFNQTVFKKTVFRFWPLWAAYFIIWLISMPLNGLVMLSMQVGSTRQTTDYMENFACRTVPGMAEAMLPLAVAFGLLSAMAVCSHLYNAKSANFFGSLPVRREGLFLTHYLAGLAFLIVPNVVIALLTLVIEAAGGWVCMEGLLFWLGVGCGECFFFYSMAVFCAMFTGHILALPVFYGVFNFLAAGIYYLGNAVLNAFYYGYDGGFGLGYRLAVWFTPVWKLKHVVYSGYRSVYPADGEMVYTISASAEVPAEAELMLNGLPHVGAYAVAGLVLAVCAFLLYRVRRLESAGDVVSVKPMRPVFKYGVAFCAGSAIGMVTAAFLNIRETGIMISIVIWGIVGYFAAQMLLDKSVRVFKKWKGAAAVTGVFVVVFLVVGFDLTGFETRMPDPDGVESVSFSGLNAMHLGDNGDYADGITTDPAQIALLMDLHEAAIGQRGGYQPGGVRYVANLSLEYWMKDGSTMSRSYSVMLDPGEAGQEGTVAWVLQQLYNDRDLYWEVYGFGALEQRLTEEGWWMEQARYEYYEYNDDYYYNGVRDPAQYYYGKDAVALYEAVKEDFLAGRIGVRDLSEANPSGPEYERDIYFTLVDGNGNYQGLTIFVQDSASSTIAALEALAEK